VLEILCLVMAPLHLKSLDPKFGTYIYMAFVISQS
jgi:hypothetical protein